ncbi:LytR C-terminal domain-containing protein [Streptomyces sp. NPDC127084]|uniref:LytR C-terminal domain-containing protein n=1 Tax=Streptomyces sp. NPDC127084 TaxID=3347133 RepID=UPI0036574458
MNDQQNPYDPYYSQQPQIIGYDEYGQPVYQQPQHSPQSYGYDPYGQQRQPYPEQAGEQPGYGYSYDYGYGSDPYTQQHGRDPYDQDPYGRQGAPQPGAAQQAPEPGPAHGYDGGHADHADRDRYDGYGAPEPHREPDRTAAVPGQRRPADDGGSGSGGADQREYRTEQFSFIEEPDEDSEDVIDWLKFTESRSERREEAKRRGRNRATALVIVLAMALIGGVGYLWSVGKLPGTGGSGGAQTAASGPQKRDVIVLHLHNTKKGGTSTALLVDNETTKQGTTVLLPNSLAVADDEGAGTTLGKSVDDDGSTGTRESIGNLLGTELTGTWRLDTPYLENLVELVGGIDITTDTEVPGAKKGEQPLVEKGENQTLNGRMAVGYATYRGSGEPEAAQLQRFGQVMYGVLRKLSSDPQAATVTIETLAQILDPSLPEKDLGASLATLSEYAKGGDYKTALLPVQQDGTLSEEASDRVVKDVLGGKVSAPEQGAAVRVGVRNATDDADATEAARIVLVNGGFSFVDAGKSDAISTSQVLYADEADKPRAVEVGKTLGLPEKAVKKGKAASNADVTVVLGGDFEVPK